MSRKRRSFTITEIVVTCVVLAATLTVCVQFLGAAAAQRRAVRNRQAAIQQSASVMERLCVRSWDELTPQYAAGVQLSDELRQILPESSLEVDITPAPEDPDAKRITVVVRWPDRSGRPQLTHRLVAWKYRIRRD